MNLHRYSLYGVTLESNRGMGGLLPATIAGEDAVTVDFAGGVEAWPEMTPHWTNGFETLWHLDATSWLLAYDAAGIERYRWTIRYDRESRLTVRWDADELLADIPSVIQGPGIAAALHLRGTPLLHACAIEISGGAILLIGVPGAGKSTTAAALVRAGFPLVSDDVAALSLDETEVVVYPGYPRLRLFEDSAMAAGFARSQMSRTFVSPLLGDKQSVDVSGAGFANAPLPVRAIYVLQPRASGRVVPVVTPVGRGDAWPLLARNVYAMRFLDDVRRFRAVRDCVSIAARIPVRSVQAGDDLSALSRLVEVLSRDAKP